VHIDRYPMEKGSLPRLQGGLINLTPNHIRYSERLWAGEKFLSTKKKGSTVPYTSKSWGEGLWGKESRENANWPAKMHCSANEHSRQKEERTRYIVKQTG